MPDAVEGDRPPGSEAFELPKGDAQVSSRRSCGHISPSKGCPVIVVPNMLHSIRSLSVFHGGKTTKFINPG